MFKAKSLHLIISRLPSRQDSFLVLSACIFPIHSWHTIVFLYNIEKLVKKATIFQLFGVYSYILLIALLESLTLFGFIVLISIILPERLFRDRFVYLGASLAILLAGLAILSSTLPFQNKSWIVSIFIILIVVYSLYIIRRPKEKIQVSGLAERLTLISSIYLFLDFLSIVYITLRQFIQI